jgi:hypothetical protein
MKSPWQEWKEKQPEPRTTGKNVSPLDFLKTSTSYAQPELEAERYSQCQSCEHLRKKTNQCKLCGCFMKLKVKLLEAECPIGKW